ncbi:DUF5050 domain-containing protein [Paenibacillus sp. QZ-Y1]|uniref:DUF5050 domain-containing protein n=1 Tax=Paenibacillus sp. QZ-Y1 TaxID=3414511 RepID=UPI003F7B05CA
MNKWSLHMQRTICTLLLFALIAAATLGGGTGAQAASLSQSIVYYESDGILYKVSGDGSGTTEVLLDFEGYHLQAAGSYLYYTNSAYSTTLLRVPNDGSKDMADTFATDVQSYLTDNGFIYYLDSKGNIYRTTGDGAPSSVKKIADKADTNAPLLTVIKGRVYYNALKNGKTWVASKATNGSGSVQWIAAGVVEDSYYMKASKNALHLMVNTNPSERFYSTNAVVMYTVNYSTGKAKAVNAKNPLDVNAVYSGGWGSNVYIYNKGIKLDSNKEYNYAAGKAFALKTSGKTLQLHTKSVMEAGALGTDKVVIIDADQKAYAKTIADSKVTKSLHLNLSNVTYVANQLTNGTPTSVYILGKNGMYSVNTALKVTKLAGEKWGPFDFSNDISGLFYTNTDDLYRLYHMEANGTGKKALSDIYIDDVLLVTPN